MQVSVHLLLHCITELKLLSDLYCVGGVAVSKK